MGNEENKPPLLDQNEDGRFTQTDMRNPDTAELVYAAIEAIHGPDEVQYLRTLEGAAVASAGVNGEVDYTAYNTAIQQTLGDMNVTLTDIIKQDFNTTPEAVDRNEFHPADRAVLDVLRESNVAFPEGIVGGADTAPRELPSPPGEKPYKSELEL